MSFLQEYPRQSSHSSVSEMTIQPQNFAHIPRLQGNRGSSYLAYDAPERSRQPGFQNLGPIRSSSYSGIKPGDLRQTEPLPNNYGSTTQNTVGGVRINQQIEDSKNWSRANLKPNDTRTINADYLTRDNQDLENRLRELKEENTAVKKLNSLLIQKLRALNEMSSKDQ